MTAREQIERLPADDIHLGLLFEEFLQVRHDVVGILESNWGKEVNQRSL